MLGLFDVAVLPLTVPIHEHNFTLKCVATPLPRLTQILPYLALEWIKPTADITTEVQKYFTENTTRALQFSPLSVSYGGVYTCRARLNVPNSVGTMKSFNLVVHSKSIT